MLRRSPLRSYTPLKRSGFKKKKGRKVSISSLKAKADKVFSEFIRRRDADESGIGSCISCGFKAPWKQLQAGHFWAKSLGMVYRYHEQNVFSQCGRCNCFLGGNGPGYSQTLRKKFGQALIEELESLRNVQLKLTANDYLELIEKYQAKLASLEAASKGGAV